MTRMLTHEVRVRSAMLIAAASVAMLLGACNSAPRAADVQADRQRSLGEAVALANRGQAAMRAGEYSRAIEHFSQSIQAAPDFGASWVLRT
jgi:tetratricopeptide (TPR) repeat protein